MNVGVTVYTIERSVKNILYQFGMMGGDWVVIGGYGFIGWGVAIGCKSPSHIQGLPSIIARACVCVCVYARVCACVCARVCARVVRDPKTKAGFV